MMNKRERITDLSVKAQTERTLQGKQVYLNDLLLEISKGTRYEFDVREAVEAYNKHYEENKKISW